MRELETANARLAAELASLDAALPPSVEIHPDVPELFCRHVAVLADLLTDEDTRPEAMVIIGRTAKQRSRLVLGYADWRSGQCPQLRRRPRRRAKRPESHDRLSAYRSEVHKAKEPPPKERLSWY